MTSKAHIEFLKDLLNFRLQLLSSLLLFLTLGFVLLTSVLDSPVLVVYQVGIGFFGFSIIAAVIAVVCLSASALNARMKLANAHLGKTKDEYWFADYVGVAFFVLAVLLLAWAVGSLGLKHN